MIREAIEAQNNRFVFTSILLAVLIVLFGCNLVFSFWNFLHGCLVENMFWVEVAGVNPESVLGCFSETKTWLPLMIKHLVK